MIIRWKFTAAALIALQITSSIYGRDLNSAEPKSRMEQIAEQQKEKARNLVPAKPDKLERELLKYVGDNPLHKYIGGIPGLHLRFGGLPKGAGLGLGPEYFRPDLASGQMSFRASAVGSDKLWYGVETELRFPHLARRYLDLRFRGHRLNATAIDYFGPGPGSEFQEEECAQYQRVETGLDVFLGFKPTRRYLNMGFSLGHLWLEIDPGDSPESTCSEEQLFPGGEPGMDTKTNYLRFGPFLEIDSRDKPEDPHSGTHFLVKFNYYMDRKHNQYSFQQIETSMEQYWPFFNKKRVIALRIHSVLGYAEAGGEIPFYMQPTLGGSSDLRGFERYRFIDNNIFLLSAEYRWEVFTILDAALFVDAGKVFHRDGDFNLQDLESDVGFGFRFKTREAVVFRVDTAFSHEGFGLWYSFDHVF